MRHEKTASRTGFQSTCGAMFVQYGQMLARNCLWCRRSRFGRRSWWDRGSRNLTSRYGNGACDWIEQRRRVAEWATLRRALVIVETEAFGFVERDFRLQLDNLLFLRTATFEQLAQLGQPLFDLLELFFAL